MTDQSNRFKNKTMLVTGAAQGIGEALTRLLIEQGAFVFAWDINREKLQRLAAELNLATPVMSAMVVDISDYAKVQEAVAEVERQRPIDGLANAAGILIPATLAETTPATWLQTFQINTHGTFHVSHCVAECMRQRRAGAIVIIASNAAHTPRMNLAAYCCSKAAIAMLGKCLGLELGRYGIRCNVVSPGSTNTPMLMKLAGGTEQAAEKSIAGDLGAYRSGIPLGKIAKPSDIARGVAFLLSEEANHITMHDLVIDGGATF